jgi:hypothetical protein
MNRRDNQVATTYGTCQKGKHERCMNWWSSECAQLVLNIGLRVLISAFHPFFTCFRIALQRGAFSLQLDRLAVRASSIPRSGPMPCFPQL